MTTRLLIATAALSLISISAAPAEPRHHGHHHHYAHRYVIPAYYYGVPSDWGARSVAAGNWSCWMGPDLLCHTVDGGTLQTSPSGNQRLP
jgi:hypothetical protein